MPNLLVVTPASFSRFMMATFFFPFKFAATASTVGRIFSHDSHSFLTNITNQSPVVAPVATWVWCWKVKYNLTKLKK